MKPFCFVALFLMACAQAQSGLTSTTGTTAGNNGSTNGATNGATNGNGGQDLSMNPSADLAGVDFSGVDFSMPSSNGDLAGQCDVVKQTGCGSNEKCVPTQSGDFCGSLGATQLMTGQLCGSSAGQSSDECQKGDGCIGITDANNMNPVALCHQFCYSDTDCKQTTVAGVPPRCNGTLTGTTQYKVCSISCNPYMSADGTNGCPAGLACTYGTDGTAPNVFEFTDCAHYGAGGDGANCNTNGNLDCKPGFICVTVGMGGTPTCHQLCEVQGGVPKSGECTTGGQSCNTFPDVTNPHFGVCL